MGKWTVDHYEQVLGSKLKGLVDGAIKRNRLEKVEPSISFEAFVEELDAGDSFTTSLIDILVKELAERRSRPTSADRRLIAERSAKSLRQLAIPVRIYHERSSSGHDELEMEEDDTEFETMLDVTMAAEGARIPTEMYEAFGGSSRRWAQRLAGRPSSSSATTRRPIGNLTSTRDRTPPWSMPPAAASSSSLFRQPSIRRAPRNRTVDFNDFTSRHRLTTRRHSENVARSDDTEWIPPQAYPASVDAAEWDPPRALRRHSPYEDDEGSSSAHAPQLARRFFGLGRSRQSPISSFPWGEAAVDSLQPENDDGPGGWSRGPSGTWFTALPTPTSSASSELDADHHDIPITDTAHAPSAAPRLRRGGLRAPESMLSRHASPIPSPLQNEQTPPRVTLLSDFFTRMTSPHTIDGGHPENRGSDLASSTITHPPISVVDQPEDEV